MESGHGLEGLDGRLALKILLQNLRPCSLAFVEYIFNGASRRYRYPPHRRWKHSVANTIGSVLF
jgi:hypothetical protein